MTRHTSSSEWNLTSTLTVVSSALGLALGPSVVAVLSIGPFITPIEQEFGWSRVEVSLGVTIISYLMLIASPLQGVLVDRFGARRVVLTSIPLFAAGVGSFYFQTDSLLAFYLIFALLPFLGIGLWPLSYLQAVSTWYDRKLGLALGCANAGIGIGSMMVPLIATALILAFDWRTAFLGLGVVILVVTWPVTYFFLRESPEPEQLPALPTHDSSVGLTFGEAIRRPAFVIMTIAFFMLGLTAVSLVTQQVPLLIEAGWSQTSAAFVQSVFGMALLFARLFVGFIIDHIFAPRVMLAVSLGGAAACILYAAVPDAAIMSAILLGFLLGAEFDVLAFLIKRYFGRTAYGRLYGVIFGVFYLGSGLGVAGLAVSRQYFGDYDVGLYAAAAVLVSCGVLVGFLPKYRFEAGAQQEVPGHTGTVRVAP